MGAQFEKWADVVGGSYYTGFGYGEIWWLLLAILLCILALWWGHRHESEANVSGVPMGGAAAGAGAATAAAAAMSTSTSELTEAAPAPLMQRSSTPKPAAAKPTTAKSASKPATKKKAPAKTKASTGPVRLNKPQGSADDLKEISGVGPKLEKTLNKLGFWHFHQIAEWKKSDVAIVDDELSFKGRIERDDWIKQAKALAKKK